MCLDGRLPSSLEHSPRAEDVFPNGGPSLLQRFAKPKRGPSPLCAISEAERGPSAQISSHSPQRGLPSRFRIPTHVTSLSRSRAQVPAHQDQGLIDRPVGDLSAGID
jgi:hypothetical protein